MVREVFEIQSGDHPAQHLKLERLDDFISRGPRINRGPRNETKRAPNRASSREVHKAVPIKFIPQVHCRTFGDGNRGRHPRFSGGGENLLICLVLAPRQLITQGFR